MSEGESREPEPTSVVRPAVEVAIRLGAIALLVGWCLVIVAPFVDVVVCTKLVEHSTVVLLDAVQVDVLLLALQNLSSVKQ